MSNLPTRAKDGSLFVLKVKPPFGPPKPDFSSIRRSLPRGRVHLRQTKSEASNGDRNARRSLFSRLARHRALRLWPPQGTALAFEPRMQLPQGTRYGNAGLDAGACFSALAAGKPLALPALRIALCGRAL